MDTMSVDDPQFDTLQGVPGDDFIIQKSSSLLSLWRSDLTLAEFKILDMYLARINSHDPDRRTVCFAKGDLERSLGVTKINGSALKQRLRNLCIAVEIEDPTRPEGFHTISLFESIDGGLGKDGQWEVELRCTKAAKKYIFNVENIGYLRYKLQEIVHLRSRYTYILFLYLEENRFRETWEISVNDLRKILKCDHIELYEDFRRFNEKILKHAQNELRQQNNYIFSYEPVRKGRKIGSVRFTLNSPPSVPYLHDHSSVFQDISPCLNEDESIQQELTASQSFVLSPCLQADDSLFSNGQLRQILQQLHELPSNALPNLVGFADNDAVSRPFQLQHLVNKCYEKLKESMKKRKIRDPFAYFMKILKQESAG